MSDTENKNLRSIFREMGETCTIHGISRVATSRYMSFRLMWLCLFAGVNIILVIQLTNLFRSYYEWPVKTSITLEFSKLQFPAISFCNMNPIRKSKLTSTSDKIRTMFDPSLVQNIAGKKRKKRAAGDNNNIKSSEQVTQSTPVLTTHVEITPTSSLDTTSVMTSSLGILPDPSDAAAASAHVTSTNFGVASTLSLDTSVQSSLSLTSIQPSYASRFDGDDTTTTYTNFWDWYRHSTYEEDTYSTSGSDYYNTGYYSSGYHTAYDYYEEWDAPKAKWAERVEEFHNAFQNESKSKRYDIGHELKDMLMSCSFATKICYAENFTRFQTVEYGNCYTIESEKFTTRRTGPLYGFWMTLNLEKLEYMTNYADAYGIKLIIHEPGTFPLPAEEGITINPSHETTVGLRMIHISRLGQPYGDCETGEEFFKNFGIKYTMQACVKLCKQTKILDQCKCMPSDLDIDIAPTEKTMLGKNVDVCNPDDEKDFLCMDDVFWKYSNGQLDCACKTPCQEVVYEKTLSGRQWPNDEYLRYSLMFDLCAMNLSYTLLDCIAYRASADTIAVERYKDNFLRLIVYYEDLNYEKISEDPLYDPFQFISDIGGTLGLFIGASILSLFEVVQLILEILKYLHYKWRGKINPSKTPISMDKIKDSRMPNIETPEFGEKDFYHMDNRCHNRKSPT